MTRPVPSFFMRYVPAESRIQRRWNGERKGDDAIISLQYPVGWWFFSHDNVLFLQTKLGQLIPNVNLAFLMPYLRRVYESRGRMREGDDAFDMFTLNTTLEAMVLRDKKTSDQRQRDTLNYHQAYDMRSYTKPHYVTTPRIENRREFATAQYDPLADQSGYIEPTN